MQNETAVIDTFVAEEVPAQKTAAWLYSRVGKATCSRFKDIIAKIGKGESAKRRNYRIQLAVERLTNEPTNNFVNTAMQHGVDQEPIARMEYEARTGAIVEEVGFIEHLTIELCGGSADGFVDADGLIEIKCPYESAIHVETLLSGAMPDDHMAQVQGLMAVTGRKWCDFISFDPRMPKGLQLFVKRIERDDAYIATLEAEVVKFLAELDAALVQMRDRLAQYE